MRAVTPDPNKSIVGLAGAAGNAIFQGAKAATLSWAYAAGVGYGAYSGFTPETLRDAYSNGAAALACVMTLADNAWAKAPTGDTTKQQASAAAHAALTLRTANSKLRDDVDRTTPPGSAAPGTQKATTNIIVATGTRAEPNLKALARAPGSQTQEQVVAPEDYEIALSSAVVTAADLLTAR